MSKGLTAATEKFDEPTVAEIRKRLDEKIPRDVISLRDGGGPKKLSYLEGWYVIARLNEVLGQGRWYYHTQTLEKVFAGEINGKQTVHYVATVQLTAYIGADPVIFTDVGYGDGSDKYNIGKAHELAVKEAVTDAVKRCAKNLGMSMGLALYDKTQENVSDEETPPVQKRTEAPAKIAAMGRVPEEPKGTVSPSAAEEAPSDRETLNQLITNTGKVLNAQKKFTVDAQRAELKKRGAESKEQLTDEQAKEFYIFLKGKLNG